MSKLYETIEALCEKNGIRPGSLCTRLGISRSLMTDLKMGRKKTVSAETAQKIAGYFGVSVGYLLGESDELEDVDIAFYGEYRELTQEQKDAVRQMVRIMRQKG
jgi:transcriptional regulator with XRE-family HTH domain